MIPSLHIDRWRLDYPWSATQYVEQDLLLSRLLISLYESPIIQENLIFRGGTALYKLHFNNPHRYSEDLDFVQIKAGPIGEIIGEVRRILNPLFPKKPSYVAHEGRIRLVYSYTAEEAPHPKMKVKIEMNRREHFSVNPIQHHHFECHSSWFEGKALISTYSIEELLGTKIRALYQRNKGRDLFDLYMAKELNPDIKSVVNIFKVYMEKSGHRMSKNEFSTNLDHKMKNPFFIQDIHPIIHPDIDYAPEKAYKYLFDNYIPFL